MHILVLEKYFWKPILCFPNHEKFILKQWNGVNQCLQASFRATSERQTRGVWRGVRRVASYSRISSSAATRVALRRRNRFCPISTHVQGTTRTVSASLNVFKYSNCINTCSKCIHLFFGIFIFICIIDLRRAYLRRIIF